MDFKARRGPMGEYIDASMKKGLLNVMLMVMIKKKRNYPYALLKTLSTDKHMLTHHIGKSEIYNTLNSLEREGLVRSRRVASGPKVQKMYSLTARGERVLGAFGKTFKGFVEEMKTLMKREFNE